MGVTYRAYDERLRIDVALKVITPGQVGDPKTQALFLREARAAARVRHPNVASVVYLNDTPGNFFYAMEFIAGESLADWLRTSGALPPMMAIGFATQIARGLAAIHEQHIVHRDLKPANLMILTAGGGISHLGSDSNPDAWQIKIIDFGLARGFGGEGPGTEVNAQTIGFRGTALYASPEQCEERGQIDGRSDLYTLGCILWEMLVGVPPFRARTHRELLNQHVAKNAPLERIAYLPDDLQAILARLLVKDPADRFADAETVVKMLENCRERLAIGGDAGGEVDLTTRDPGPIAPPTSNLAPVDATSNPAAASEPKNWVRGAIGMVVAAVLVVAVAGWLLSRGKASLGLSAAVPSAVPAASTPPTVAVSRKAVAVLPFANISAEKDNEYFADGIHEDVLTNLSKIRDLKVISRTSVMRFKGGQHDLREIAKLLGVGTVVEGSVRKAGNRVRVSAQLIDAATDQHLWADNFDGGLDDVFEIQSQIAGKIATALAANISPEETIRIERKPTENALAYEYLLRGREAGRRGFIRGGDALRESVEYLRKAIEADPGFAMAYAVLSIVEGNIFSFGYDQSDAQFKRVRESADIALRLQPELSDAHLAAGYSRFKLDSDYSAALGEFQMAVRLLPNNAECLDAEAMALRRLNRWEESAKASRRALEISPMGEIVISNLAWTMRYLHQYDEAEGLFRRVAEMLVGYTSAKRSAAWCAFFRTADFSSFYTAMHGLESELDPLGIGTVNFRLITRDYAGLVAALEPRRENMVRNNPGACPASFFLGWAHILSGDKASAEIDLRNAVEQLKRQVHTPTVEAMAQGYLAQANALLGLPNEARQAAERAMALLPEGRDAVTGRAVMESAACAFTWLGDRDRAIDLLEHLLQVPSASSVALLRFDPRWDPLRGHPRFERLIAAKP